MLLPSIAGVNIASTLSVGIGMEHRHHSHHRRMLDALWRSATALPGYGLSEHWGNGWALIWIAGFFVLMALDGAEYWHYFVWSLGWIICVCLFDQWRFDRWWRDIKDRGGGGR